MRENKIETKFIVFNSDTFFVLYNCVIYDCNKYHASVICDIISYSLSIFKIKKSKNKNKNKNKIETKFTTHNSNILLSTTKS